MSKAGERVPPEDDLRANAAPEVKSGGEKTAAMARCVRAAVAA